MKALIFLFGFALSTHAFANQAQPVPVPEDQSLSPQVEIAGSGAATLQTKSGIDFSDSALMVGAAERLQDGKSIGSVGLGWMTIDDTNEGLSTQVFLNQAFLDYQSEHFEILMGRSDNPNAHLVDFPTIRGDDLVTLLNPLNPFSNGVNTEEHRYSNVASFTINQNFKYYENFHIQHLVNSIGSGTKTGINSFGATFEYRGAPGMEAFTTIPNFDFGYEHYDVDTHSKNGLHAFTVGGILNLNESVTNRVDLRLQDILELGSSLTSFSSTNDSFQANSNAISASIRYLSSPFGKAGYQIALTTAYKNYFDIDQAKSYGGAVTLVKRLGQGFDLVTQYQITKRDSALAFVQGDEKTEQKAEIGFVFSFDATINQHLSPRRSLLNQEHQYVPN